MGRRLTAAEFRDVRVAWQRRQDRIPAKFASHLNYCAAVESGLLEKEPVCVTVPSDPFELLTDIRAATTEAMPQWQPQGKATCNSQIEWPEQPDDDD